MANKYSRLLFTEEQNKAYAGVMALFTEDVQNNAECLKGKRKDIQIKMIEIINKFPDILQKQENNKFGNGVNIGMVAALFKFGGVVLRALEDDIASLQQDGEGKNIGMYCIEQGLQNSAKKALENSDAAMQQENLFHWNIGMYATNYGFFDVAELAVVNQGAACQKDNDGKSLQEQYDEMKRRKELEEAQTGYYISSLNHANQENLDEWSKSF